MATTIYGDGIAGDAFLTSISTLGTAANKLIYTTGVDTADETDISADARTMLAAANNTGICSAIGVGPEDVPTFLGIILGVNGAWESTNYGGSVYFREKNVLGDEVFGLNYFGNAGNRVNIGQFNRGAGSFPSAKFHVWNNMGATAGGLPVSIFQGANGQTAKLTEWRKYDNTIIASIDNEGRVFAGGLRGVPGRVSPAYTFADDSATGINLWSAGNMEFIVNGSYKFGTDGNSLQSIIPLAINSIGPYSGNSVSFLANTNVLIGGTSSPDSMTRGLVIASGVAPTSYVGDTFAFYSKDIVAGYSAPHFMVGETSMHEVRLYRQNHIADPTGGVVVDAEARSALSSILITLENLGFLATS